MSAQHPPHRNPKRWNGQRRYPPVEALSARISGSASRGVSASTTWRHAPAPSPARSGGLNLVSQRTSASCRHSPQRSKCLFADSSAESTTASSELAFHLTQYAPSSRHRGRARVPPVSAGGTRRVRGVVVTHLM